MEILEETSVNVLVKHDDGSVENVSISSPRNRLAYKHGLFGLVIERDEIRQYDTPEGVVYVIPHERGFALRVDDDLPMPVMSESLTEFYELLIEAEQGDPLVLVDYYRDEFADADVRRPLLAELATAEPFAGNVQAAAEGWYIYDHLRLTYALEMYHDHTDSLERSGGISEADGANLAYDLQLPDLPDGHQRRVTIDGREYELTDHELDFVAMAVWALAYAPQEQPSDRGAERIDWLGEVEDGQFRFHFE